MRKKTYIVRWAKRCNFYYVAVLYALRVLPVRLSVPLSRTGLVTRKQKCRKIKIILNVPQGTSKWSDNFQLKRSTVKITRRQQPQKIAAYLAYLFTYGRPQQLDGRPHTMSAFGADICSCFWNNFGRYRLALIILSMLHSMMNCRQSWNIFQLLLSLLLHYLAKFE